MAGGGKGGSSRLRGMVGRGRANRAQMSVALSNARNSGARFSSLGRAG